MSGGAAGFLDDGVGVVEDLVDGHGVHLAAVVVAGLDGLLEVAAGGLGGEVVGDDLAGAALLLDPGELGMAIQTGLPLTAKRMSVASAWRVAMATMVPFQTQWRGSPVQRSVTVKSSYMVFFLGYGSIKNAPGSFYRKILILRGLAFRAMLNSSKEKG
jgi:hypothetical protein